MDTRLLIALLVDQRIYYDQWDLRKLRDLKRLRREGTGAVAPQLSVALPSPIFIVLITGLVFSKSQTGFGDEGTRLIISLLSGQIPKPNALDLHSCW